MFRNLRDCPERSALQAALVVYPAKAGPVEMEAEEAEAVLTRAIASPPRTPMVETVAPTGLRGRAGRTDSPEGKGATASWG
jgi:hypothetical protein